MVLRNRPLLHFPSMVLRNRQGVYYHHGYFHLFLYFSSMVLRNRQSVYYYHGFYISYIIFIYITFYTFTYFFVVFFFSSLSFLFTSPNHFFSILYSLVGESFTVISNIFIYIRIIHLIFISLNVSSIQLYY